MDKLYICVLDEFPDYMTPTLVAHAVLRHHQHNFMSDDRYECWLEHSFKKCVVRVNRKEFDKIKKISGVVESWENNTMNGDVSCLTIISDGKEHNVLKFAKLWKPQGEIK